MEKAKQICQDLALLLSFSFVPASLLRSRPIGAAAEQGSGKVLQEQHEALFV